MARNSGVQTCALVGTEPDDAGLHTRRRRRSAFATRVGRYGHHTYGLAAFSRSAKDFDPACDYELRNLGDEAGVVRQADLADREGDDPAPAEQPPEPGSHPVSRYGLALDQVVADRPGPAAKVAVRQGVSLKVCRSSVMPLLSTSWLAVPSGRVSRQHCAMAV
jgi:hypothetical protein